MSKLTFGSKRLATAASLGLACAACALFPQGALAGTPDQSQLLISGDGFIDAGLTRAQTFTAGITGTLDQVHLALSKSGTPSAPLIVEIRDTLSGRPGPTVLASASVAESNVASGPPSVDMPFFVSVPSTAGTQYAIVLYSASDKGVGYYRWAGYAGDPYPAGAVFGSTNTSGAGPWGGPFANGEDEYFFTTVVPGTATVTTGQRAAALKKCKKKHSKQARKKCRKKAQRLPL